MNSMASFGKVQHSLANPWILAFYVVGIVAASWHFGYGVWLFAAKWGCVTGDRARRRFGYACVALSALLIVIGQVTIPAFFRWPPQPLGESSRKALFGVARQFA